MCNFLGAPIGKAHLLPPKKLYHISTGSAISYAIQRLPTGLAVNRTVQRPRRVGGGYTERNPHKHIGGGGATDDVAELTPKNTSNPRQYREGGSASQLH